ncbi:MAG: phycobiliprotein lyase, partial [Synechococcales cyanobacterium]
MDILDFFQLNAGKWFTHRTTQHLMSHQSRGSQSTWLIKWLDQHSMEIYEACQRMTIASHSILG